MEPLTRIDATRYSFEKFVSFIFNHDIPAKSEKQWYWNADVTFVPDTICAYYLRLFREPEFLLNLFSKPQLEEGFWAMMSGTDWSIRNLVWEPEVSFSTREECVRAMFDLFKRFFSVEPLDTSCHMWWDAMCYDWHSGNRRREKGGEDLEMQDVMFQTLAGILFLESQPCQTAALHGLGHLHHPETKGLIQRYIAAHPSLSEAEKEYASAAARFEVL
jgi:hypothetical protein